MERLNSFGRTLALAGSILAAGCAATNKDVRQHQTDVRAAHAVREMPDVDTTGPLVVNKGAIEQLLSQIGGKENKCALLISKVREIRGKMGGDIEGVDPQDAKIDCSLISTLRQTKDEMDKVCKDDVGNGLTPTKLSSVFELQRRLYQRMLQWGIAGYNATNAIQICDARATARSSR